MDHKRSGVFKCHLMAYQWIISRIRHAHVQIYPLEQEVKYVAQRSQSGGGEPWLLVPAYHGRGKHSIEYVYRPLREMIWDIEARGGDRVFAAFTQRR